ncbi:MAG: serine/threonine-protein kinase [Planctomycetota bacterium]
MAGTESIFYEAIELPSHAREAFIARACGSDTAQQKEVCRLLASHEMNCAGDFLLARPMATLQSTSAETAEIAESEGDTIGRYRLLEKIGEGGMGVVYMAEQTEGIRRRVALKIIKLGMDTRQVIARFEAERQAMALFDHASITRVFDAGSTSAGRPYFVMELVRGSSVTEYVQSRSLSLKQRLKLFVGICKAVHHAHQKGILHRDLKPSNILVTHFDGVPVPKVIDFGIAKAIGQDLTDKTLFTRYAAMVGTPQYMSPEQAEMTGLDVDTRTDIYSLGVLLYELVTGSTPLSSKELRNLNPLALFETLRDADIETPSLRAARMRSETESKTTTRSETPTREPVTIPAERLKGDLDWVVMKAIARDRTLRYDSASDLGADVERFLKGDPVHAAPPSRVYWMKSVWRKHRTATVSALLFGLTISIASIACLVLAIQNHTANKDLKSANAELTSTIAQLQKAEATIRQSAENDKYRSAISLAMMKFDTEFLQTMAKIGDRLIAEELSGFLPEAGSGQEDWFMGEDILFPNEFFEQAESVCFVYDRNRLIDLRHAGLLNSALRPVLGFIAEEHKMQEEMFATEMGMMNESQFDFFLPSEDHDGHSEICLKVQDETNRLLPEHRHKFFRLLVSEYRRAFGETDRRVAEALNLLAASLIEVGKHDEAEARLRESMILSGEQVSGVAHRLLEITRAERGQLKK